MDPKIAFQKVLASRIFPRYSRTLEKFNWNARWMAMAKAADPAPRFRSRVDLHAFVYQQFCGSGPIDYMEFGVWKGESMRLWCERDKHPDSRFFGFDSFEGLPEDWLPTNPKGHFSTGGKLPDIADSRVQFIVGWFQKTLPGFLAGYEKRDAPLVIHCDADLYSSTLFVLASLDKIVRPGTVVIFDEFDTAQDEYRALLDWSGAFMRTYEVVGVRDGFRQVAIRITS